MKALQKGEIAIDTWDIIVIHDALSDWLQCHPPDAKDYDNVKLVFDTLSSLQLSFWIDPKDVVDDGYYHD